MVRVPLTEAELVRGERLGALLRRERGDRSMVEVAAAAGISVETLRKIEAGRIPTPAFFTVAAITRALGIALDTVAELAEDHRQHTRAGYRQTAGVSFVRLVAIVVDEYDPAITFFTELLGFELAEDSPARSNRGAPKRWVVVRPPGGQTGILLARADGVEQAAAVGNQTAGRVGFFLQVDDFDASYRRMRDAGVEFLGEPRTEPYGRVAVFLDIAGNRWDLLGPRA